MQSSAYGARHLEIHGLRDVNFGYWNLSMPGLYEDVSRAALNGALADGRSEVDPAAHNLQARQVAYLLAENFKSSSGQFLADIGAAGPRQE